MEPKLPYADCDNCALKDESFVPPSGDGSGYIVVVGEAPGADEVKIGKPFVGRSGQLLRQTLTRIGIEVERVYYTNSVMCRPPKNRDPKPTEIKACRRRLFEEISKIKPSIVVPLGKFGHQAITGRGEKIKKARGKPEYISIIGHDCASISSIHPAALLRMGDDFPDLCSDLATALEIHNGAPVFIEPPVDSYIIIKDSERMNKLLCRLENLVQNRSPEDILAVDLETDDLIYLNKDIITCAVSWKGYTAVAFDWDLIRRYPEYRARFSAVIKVMPCAFHNGMFDIPWLHQEGMSPNLQWDTMLSSYTLDERKGIHDLEHLSISYHKAPAYKLGEEIKNARGMDRNKLLVYNATDADYTRRLTDDLFSEMDDKDLGVMNDILLPAAAHFIRQYEDGMLIDRDKLEANGDRWEKERNNLLDQMRSFPGAENLNPNSPAQVSSYIYDKLELEQMGGGKIDTIDKMTLLNEIQDVEDPEAQEYWHTQSVHTFDGMPARSTNTYMLFWLAQQHEFPRLMVKYRLVGKRYGTYYKGLKEAIWEDGRIRPSWKLHGTVTGRQSSNGPNLHGTPRDPTIKDIYVSDPGFALLYGDFPQAEVRMLAHFSKDDNLIRAISEEDIHKAVAKQLYSLSDDEWEALPSLDKAIKRRAAKTIVFGIIYGRGPRGLAPQLGVSAEEAQLMIDRLLSIMPSAKRWITEMKMQVLTSHQVQSLYGRKRRFSLIADKRQRSEVQRQAVNMPIQSSVSDMTLRAYCRTCGELERLGMKIKRYSQIHDSFTIQVEEHAVQEAGQIMRNIMENQLDFETDVPFGPVEIESGRSWGSLVPIK